MPFSFSASMTRWKPSVSARSSSIVRSMTCVTADIVSPPEHLSCHVLREARPPAERPARESRLKLLVVSAEIHVFLDVVCQPERVFPRKPFGAPRIACLQGFDDL